MGQSVSLLVEINGPVIERATDLRARYSFKTPDAIHLATAIDEGASVFLTGDAELVRCAELNDVENVKGVLPARRGVHGSTL